VVQPFLTDGMRAVCGVLHEGRFVALVHQRYLRIWPPDAGTACAAVTTEPDEQLEQRLLRLLDGHEGLFQVQLLGDFVIDVNPRLYGSLPLAVASGANLPALWCEVLAGQGPRELVRGRAGVHYRWTDADLRAIGFALAGRRMPLGALLDAVRPRRGTAHSISTLSDLRPLLSRAASVRSLLRG
jgi:predicted ATP-grasp superfamily ATP-dependent carboligase